MLTHPFLGNWFNVSWIHILINKFGKKIYWWCKKRERERERDRECLCVHMCGCGCVSVSVSVETNSLKYYQEIISSSTMNFNFAYYLWCSCKKYTSNFWLRISDWIINIKMDAKTGHPQNTKHSFFQYKYFFYFSGALITFLYEQYFHSFLWWYQAQYMFFFQSNIRHSTFH